MVAKQRVPLNEQYHFFATKPFSLGGWGIWKKTGKELGQE
jgi:hypothetical protein